MANELLRIVIPGEPKAKGRPRFGYSKKVGRVLKFSDSSTMTVENWIRFHAGRAVAAAGWTEPNAGPLALLVDFYLERPKKPRHRDFPAGRPDLDNLVKAVLDGMNLAGVWRDDAQVCTVQAWKMWAGPIEGPTLDEGGPRTVVQVLSLSPGGPSSRSLDERS